MTEFWNSLESVSKLSSYANGAIALLGIFAALIGAAVFVLGRRVALLSDRETTEANRTRDALISSNNLSTAEAKKEAALALERSRLLEAESLKDKLKIAKLEKRTDDRNISNEVGFEMIALLKDHSPKVPILFQVQTGDQETDLYAGKLAAIFMHVGIEVQNFGGIPVSGIPTGIRVYSKPGDVEAEKQVALLKKAILLTGVTPITDNLWNYQGFGRIEIIVGLKP